MKQRILTLIMLVAAGSALAADSPAADQVNNAIAKLQAAPNFSWTMTTKIPGLPFEPGPLKGRAERDGFAVISQELGDWTLEAVFKGEKVALKADGEWRLPDPSDGRAMMMSGLVVRYGTAVHEIESLIKNTTKLKAGEDGVLAGELTEQGAKDLLTFHRAGDGQGPPPPKNAQGSVRFWLKDGVLSKFESHVQGSVQFTEDGDARDFSITRTLQLQDVGTTKTDVPAEARQKLEPKA